MQKSSVPDFSLRLWRLTPGVTGRASYTPTNHKSISSRAPVDANNKDCIGLRHKSQW
jgi:hypothetical protein